MDRLLRIDDISFAVMAARTHAPNIVMPCHSCSILSPIPRQANPSTFPAPSPSHGLLAPSIRSVGPIRHSSGPRHATPYCSLSEPTIFDTRRVVDLVIIPATTEILEIDHLPRLAGVHNVRGLGSLASSRWITRSVGSAQETPSRLETLFALNGNGETKHSYDVGDVRSVSVLG
jgi:hypothetical protein